MDAAVHLILFRGDGTINERRMWRLTGHEWPRHPCGRLVIRSKESWCWCSLEPKRNFRRASSHRSNRKTPGLVLTASGCSSVGTVLPGALLPPRPVPLYRGRPPIGLAAANILSLNLKFSADCRLPVAGTNRRRPPPGLARIPARWRSRRGRDRSCWPWMTTRGYSPRST